MLGETWKHEPAELWETHHKHIFMGAGKYDNKHGVGIMLNKRWRKRIVGTEYINERAITPTILVNRQHIKLMSVHFPHSKYADHHIEKMYKTIEKHMMNNKKYIPIIGGDFNAELGLGKGTECKSVGRCTLNESNKRGDWLKSWLMLNDYTALNTTSRKTPHKQTSFVSPKGKEKQIDHILTKRRYLRNVKDAEASDMIHTGSDHRCIMATFLINTPGKDTHGRRENKKHETIGYVEHEQKEKHINIEVSELEERYHEIFDIINKPPPEKETKYMTQEITQKNKSKKDKAAAATNESTLAEAEAQGTERKSMKSSSTEVNLWSVPAQPEHRRQDGGRRHPVGVLK